ncbi:tRNA pseudouridine(55) synthase TruB [Candidatus Micrarchaeota archaeon CG1_02_55_22]|nr:MAG: tRNA pseudouridine(55) synthase TruB [Candidatus Micrarchaeota archaeon CG1_02_55_22]
MKVLRTPEYSFGIAPRERSVKQLLASAVVPVDKPPGPSSHEVSSIVRKMLSIPKTGHSGTLDPDVSGVLPVLLGSACKVAKLLLSSKKEYVCVMRLGEALSKEKLEEVLDAQRGEIYQTPPLASAVKKALRTRKVYELELLEDGGQFVLFRARVQAGTYIRTMCRDIGLISGVGAEMAELRRTRAAGIMESKAVTLQELADRYWLWNEHANEAPLREILLPLEECVHIKRIVIDDRSIHYICTGCDGIIDNITEYDERIRAGETVGVYSGKGELLCIVHARVEASEFESNDGPLFSVKRVVIDEKSLATAARPEKRL